MDSDNGSRKEEDEHDETPMERTTEKTEPIEGSHGEPNVGKPPVAT